MIIKGVTMKDNVEEQDDDNYLPLEYGDATIGESEDQEELEDVPDDDQNKPKRD